MTHGVLLAERLRAGYGQARDGGMKGSRGDLHRSSAATVAVGSRWRARRIADAEARLSELSRELEAQGERVTWEVIRRRDVASALGEIGRCGLPLGGHHGLSGVDRALLGSVATKLLRETTLPLLVVPLRG